MSSRVLPPLLEPYLTLPLEASLILLTSVLGASTNWLVLRFLHSILAPGSPQDVPFDEPKIILVSFLRDLAFWKESARRQGLDLDKLALKKRFAFVDGLSGLFLPKQSTARAGVTVLSDSGLESVEAEIRKVIEGMGEVKGKGGGKVLLVFDQLDLLLAAGGEDVRAVELEEMVLGLRELVHATIMTISADQPLVAAHQTPLESNHAAFLLGLAHQADFIMSLRLLDSGTARDVSGVLRVTIGDKAAGVDQESSKKLEEKELLYFVGGDGGVNVFERGQ